MMNFTFYSCILEGRQLWVEEPFLLAASEVVRAVCKAGFQNNSDYVFECVQPPKDGMFLFKVTRKTDGFSTLVFFDTRTKPNFIWVENVFDDELDMTIRQFVKMLGKTLSAASYVHGWKVWLEKYVPDELQDLKLFKDALEYVESYMEKDVFVNKEAFRSIVITDAIADEVMVLIKKYMKGKNTPRTLIAPLKAARVTGAVIKVSKAMYKEIFGNILGKSISSVDRYMSDDYVWNSRDTVFIEMKNQFAILVNMSKMLT
ncbi:hypothetical protein SAMN04488494_2530 [Xylanibacter ruminicola]|uniref:Uncharacterized protein n=1 Tax=Xylanibacter ruminicola TaxID=839 RepID=A0A1M7LCB5_XYLRU|nr:hypothetical protein [Xylanibacter ruminicola]SFC80163.1 hypothetical protein SAMN04488493_1245 [Xylanibacter ruminicola]SHM75645.1 hypothetical protein SAMN04488494_2530 [Xylanibacter ruminicola]